MPLSLRRHANSAQDKAIISIVGTIKRFSYAPDSVTILRNVELQITTGEIVMVFGGNGSGKSSLLRSAIGIHPFLRPATIDGEVRINGDILDAALFRQRSRAWCYVGQDPDTGILSSTPRREILLDLLAAGQSQLAIKTAFDRVISEFRLQKLLDRPITSLSQGEKQRVILAAALGRGADVLALDEPTAMLDCTAVAELTQLLLGMKSRVCLLVASHHSLFLVDDIARKLDLSPVVSVRGTDPSESDITASLSRAYTKSVRVRENLVEAKAITFRRDHGFALGPLDFRWRGGNIIWLKGSNGSGKSTLLRMLARIEKPNSGQFVFQLPARLSSVLVVQNPSHQIFGGTVHDDLMLISHGRDIDSSFIDFGDVAWNIMGPEASLTKNPHRLSFGQKRFLSLLYASASSGLVLFDEPTQGLDSRRLTWLQNYVRALASLGRIVVFSSHDGAFASALATETVDMDAYATFPS